MSYINNPPNINETFIIEQIEFTGVTVDTYVTGFTYSPITNTITLSQNAGQEDKIITITGMSNLSTETFVSTSSTIATLNSSAGTFNDIFINDGVWYVNVYDASRIDLIGSSFSNSFVIEEFQSFIRVGFGWTIVDGGGI